MQSGSETGKPDARRKSSAWRTALRSRGVQLVLVIVVLGIAFATWLDFKGGPDALMDQMGPAAPAILVSAIAVVSATPLPSELIAIPMTGIYGFWPGAIMIWVAWFIAAYLQYFVARRTARDFDFDRAHARLPHWLRRFPVSHPAFLICARWFPWGPHLVNTAAGVFGVALVRHGWCAAVSIAPQALFFSAVGNALVRLW